MDVEQAREFLLKLPHVRETMQWGANLVYWVGDKAIGGKMFALLDLGEDRERVRGAVASFYAGPEKSADLLETEGLIPAPYLARAHWVALTGWHVLGRRELEELLRAAHAGVFDRLPKRVRAEIEHQSTPGRAKLR